MGLAARELARTLSWQAMASRYLSLYERLAARRAVSAMATPRATVSVES
jgi:hypothetical protein